MQYRIKTTKNKKLKFQSKLYSITPLKKKLLYFSFLKTKLCVKQLVTMEL